MTPHLLSERTRYRLPRGRCERPETLTTRSRTDVRLPLHRKGWLGRVREGKAYRYTATASREEYSARLMREALAGGGDAEVVLSHFVAQIGSGESDALRSVLRKRCGRGSG
jgi:Penicillinase repressor